MSIIQITQPGAPGGELALSNDRAHPFDTVRVEVTPPIEGVDLHLCEAGGQNAFARLTIPSDPSVLKSLASAISQAAEDIEDALVAQKGLPPREAWILEAKAGENTELYTGISEASEGVWVDSATYVHQSEVVPASLEAGSDRLPVHNVVATVSVGDEECECAIDVRAGNLLEAHRTAHAAFISRVPLATDSLVIYGESRFCQRFFVALFPTVGELTEEETSVLGLYSLSISDDRIDGDAPGMAATILDHFNAKIPMSIPEHFEWQVFNDRGEPLDESAPALELPDGCILEDFVLVEEGEASWDAAG